MLRSANAIAMPLIQGDFAMHQPNGLLLTPPPAPLGPGAGNDEIAATFDNIAELLELEDANPFLIRAYRNAARTLRALTFDVAKMILRGEPLPKLQGAKAD